MADNGMPPELTELIDILRRGDHSLAREAVERLREYGWLYDDSLKGADLTGANLSGLDLREARLMLVKLNGADLRGVDLQDAYLSWADLRGANLRGSDLRNANFSGARLSGATFRRADIRNASFIEANLKEVSFVQAKLQDAKFDWASLFDATFYDADLTKASLRGVDLCKADLRRTNLSEALLVNTDFSGADVTEANFTAAWCGATVFANLDLSTVKGLDTIRHISPSTIGVDTLFRSKDHLPIDFLHGCGVSGEMMKNLNLIPLIKYDDCYLIFSHRDAGFAYPLCEILQNEGIRCWLDEHDTVMRYEVRNAINDAIRQTEKILLCCSTASLGNEWIEPLISEILAWEAEYQQKNKTNHPVFYLLDLDGYLYDGYQGSSAEILRKRLVIQCHQWEYDAEFHQSVQWILELLDQSI